MRKVDAYVFVFSGDSFSTPTVEHAKIKALKRATVTRQDNGRPRTQGAPANFLGSGTNPGTRSYSEDWVVCFLGAKGNPEIKLK